MTAQFAPQLIRKYNVNAARYTSYPTANVFHEADAASYLAELECVDAATPLSLYVHVPFCATICYYCACNKINTGNRKHAEAYIDRLVTEMNLHSGRLRFNNPVAQLHFGGGTPTFLNEEQFERVFAGLREYFNLIDIPSRDYSIEIDPRALAPARIEHLATLGFNRMSVGIQDFDPAVQEAVNRIQSETETANVVNCARENGFASINVDLIYGLPLQSEDGFKRTIERVIDLDPDRISLYNYAHLPERFKTQRQIRATDLPGPETKLKLMGTAIRMFSEAGYDYVGMDHFAKPTDGLLQARQAGTLHRNFQGYTTHGNCELIAMGVSAISKVGKTYAQNAKTLEAYYAAIDAGQFATDRGFNLNEDDVIRADAIQRLMCCFTLDVTEFSARYEFDFWSYFDSAWPQLQELAADGLVDLQEERIAVTRAGRFLIRNVCTIFDMHADKQTTGFSRAL